MTGAWLDQNAASTKPCDQRDRGKLFDERNDDWLIDWWCDPTSLRLQQPVQGSNACTNKPRSTTNKSPLLEEAFKATPLNRLTTLQHAIVAQSGKTRSTVLIHRTKTTRYNKYALAHRHTKFVIFFLTSYRFEMLVLHDIVIRFQDTMKPRGLLIKHMWHVRQACVSFFWRMPRRNFTNLEGNFGLITIWFLHNFFHIV
jgi:hypothetical protein